MISSLPQVVGLFCLVLLSAFFSSAEISLSAASKTRLMALSEDGDRRAAMVLEMREHPGAILLCSADWTKRYRALGRHCR